MVELVRFQQKINRYNPFQIRLFIVLVSGLFFIPFLGNVHLFDWDEINFAEAAREMMVTGDYLNVQINFQPFWEKPPLFIWMQVLSMKLFGINEFAARFPNAICGIVSLLTIFNIGRKTKDNTFGLLWALAYMGSVLPFFYFKSGIIDPWFNLFMFLGVYHLIHYSEAETDKLLQNAILSGIFTGLAVLTKGPVGFLMVAFTTGIYIISVGFRVSIRFVDVMLFLLLFVMVGGSWFLVQIANRNTETVVDFIVYQIRLFQTKDAGHGGFFGYHFIVLFFGVFPTSVFAISALKNEKIKDEKQKLVKRWMIILLAAVLFVFSIVKTKIIHYSSLAYFPLSFLAANYVYNALHKRVHWQQWQSILVFFIGCIIALPVIFVSVFDGFKGKIIANNWINDDFAVANLQANGGWTGFEFLIGTLFIFFIIAAFLKFKKYRIVKRALAFWVLTSFFMFFALSTIVSKVEKYSQGALIEFFESKAGQDVYLKNMYFKSYATYFYGNTQPPQNTNFYDTNWLLKGDIDKDVYFVCKIHQAYQMEEFPDIEQIDAKNGFVFFLRKDKK